jgi:hypothetical protein
MMIAFTHEVIWILAFSLVFGLIFTDTLVELLASLKEDRVSFTRRRKRRWEFR